MRVIAVKTLKSYCETYPQAEQSLLAWYQEITSVNWESPAAMKSQYRNASLITGKRIVFNIHGNAFRLIVDVEFRLRIVFIVWFGTHKEYDRINAKTISHDCADKK